MVRIGWKAFIFITLLLLLGCSKDASKQGYRLLIYYGTPVGVNHVWNEDKSAKIFAQYDYIILGEDLNDPTHVHHRSTQRIINKVRDLHPTVMFFGYINADMLEEQLPLHELVKHIENWQLLGADGILIDCMGYDFFVTRERQNAIIDEVHKRGMPVLVNAWDPDDVMGNGYDPQFNPNLLPSKLGQGDYYLLEKFLLPYDVYDEENPSLFAEGFLAKMNKALGYRINLGVKLLSVSRIDYNQITEESLMKFFKMNEAMAFVFSLDGYGVSSVEYSSSSEDQDLVVLFPYMSNYMDYYNLHDTIRYDENMQQFSRGEFFVRSRKGDHEFHLP